MAGSSSLGAIAAGALAGALAAALVLSAGWADRDGGDRDRPDPETVDDFLVSWERSRTATYKLQSRFRRRVEGASGILARQDVVQRPPDRIVIQGGGVDARLDGRRLSCATGPDEEMQCRDLGPAPPYDEEVADEVDTLEDYVRGPRPPYVVERAGACFRLRLTVELPDASRTYGDRAEFCFDPATGALLRTVVTRATSEDVTEVVDLTAEVDDRDLRLPDDAPEEEPAG